MIIFFSVFFALYGAMNYYIFIRGWQVLALYPYLKPVYLILFLIASLSYLLAKFIGEYLSAFVYDALLWIGSFWFAFMVYFFLCIVLIDFVRLINLKFQFLPDSVSPSYKQLKLITAIVVIVLTSALIIYGFINTRIISIKTVNIELPKRSGKLNELNAILAA